MRNVLGFDVGATKTAWGVFSEEGNLLECGKYATPTEVEPFVESLEKIIAGHDVIAVGVGMPGVISADKRSTLLCGNIPDLSDLNLADRLELGRSIVVTLDNHARCALIGEVWKGSAQNLESAVLVTIGTGIGGAVMQKGRVLPHPADVSQEISRIVVDPTDVFPSKTGAGSVEAFLGGRNLEERFQIDLKEEASKVREGDEEAKEVWHAISYYFIQCMKAVHSHYHCESILIGGIGGNDLEYYLQDPAPCTIIPTFLGEKSALYGAARVALDVFEEKNAPEVA